jgi:hypothetical protein
MRKIGEDMGPTFMDARAPTGERRNARLWQLICDARKVCEVIWALCWIRADAHAQRGGCGSASEACCWWSSILHWVAILLLSGEKNKYCIPWLFSPFYTCFIMYLSFVFLSCAYHEHHLWYHNQCFDYLVEDNIHMSMVDHITFVIFYLIHIYILY